MKNRFLAFVFVLLVLCTCAFTYNDWPGPILRLAASDSSDQLSGRQSLYVIELTGSGKKEILPAIEGKNLVIYAMSTNLKNACDIYPYEGTDYPAKKIDAFFLADKGAGWLPQKMTPLALPRGVALNRWGSADPGTDTWTIVAAYLDPSAVDPSETNSY